jgi:CDP-paratose 2-epimerase
MSNVLITGGAGFVGCNVAERFIQEGKKVTICDNLSRRGANKNLQWLCDKFGADMFRFLQVDIRDMAAMTSAVVNQDVIIHLAGQVAVTSSVVDPRNDFENNVWGTFNVLESARLGGQNPIILYSSTNKVYGGMEDTEVVLNGGRYEYRDYPLGIPETYPLDFHSPYGCSKGGGDQYVRDYARIYGMRTVVFRQSCIYGPRQMGVEDQGWLAWFTIAAQKNKPISIYGDGKQVRDVLYVDDLIDAYEAAILKIDQVSGQIYNIGGGATNTLSVWSELGPMLEQMLAQKIPVTYADWRPGDQRIYVSDIRKSYQDLGWSPKTDVRIGVQNLVNWVKENQGLFE